MLWRLADNTDDEDDNENKKAKCLFLPSYEVPTLNDDDRQYAHAREMLKKPLNSDLTVLTVATLP